VKTKEDIEKRLRKLRFRYAHKYIQASQERKHLNCVFNEVHETSALPYTKTKSVEMPLAPREQVTLVVFQNKPDTSVHLCMYGSGDPEKWQGSTCDSDDISKSCSMFKPKIDANTAKDEFLELVSNDEYVFDNYRDVATLQWVLGERVHEIPLSVTERFFLWLRCLFTRVLKPSPQLPPPSISEDLWNDSSPNT
jgi:hypothetical protein